MVVRGRARKFGGHRQLLGIEVVASYVHRVLLRGGAPFRNVTIEFLQPRTPSLVCLTEGPMTPTRGSRQDNKMSCATGGFHLLEHSGAASLKNDGTHSMELVVIFVP